MSDAAKRGRQGFWSGARIAATLGRLDRERVTAEVGSWRPRCARLLGYAPVDLGGTEDCAVMEAPRRDGAVYGEEYRLAEAEKVAGAVRAGEPPGPAPRYAEPTA